MTTEEINQITQQGVDAINQLETLSIQLKQALSERDAAINSLSLTVSERDGAISSLNQALSERDNAISSLNDLVTQLNYQVETLTNQNNGTYVLELQNQIAMLQASYDAQSQSYSSQINELYNLLAQEEQNDYAEAQAAYETARTELQSQIDSANQFVADAAGRIAEAERVRDEALNALVALAQEAVESNQAGQSA